jgi:hypothetical protein
MAKFAWGGAGRYVLGALCDPLSLLQVARVFLPGPGRTLRRLRSREYIHGVRRIVV